MSWELLLAGGVLLATVCIGTLAHEWSHLLVLRLTGITYSIEYLPGRHAGLVGALASSPWAVVRPHLRGHESTVTLRCAALMPLTLTLPVIGLAIAGSLPGADQPIAIAGLIGWLACALPSPNDFSVVWHAPTVLERSAADDNYSRV